MPPSLLEKKVCSFTLCLSAVTLLTSVTIDPFIGMSSLGCLSSIQRILSLDHAFHVLGKAFQGLAVQDLFVVVLEQHTDSMND